MDSPRQVGRKQFSGGTWAAAAAYEERRRGGYQALGITDSACKNQLVVGSVQYGPFNPYIPIRSTTIGKSRVAKDPIAMRTSWRSNSDIVSVIRRASSESSTTKHRLLHASGSYLIPPPNDPNTTKTSDFSTRQMVTTWKVRTRVVR
ncbi:hypothetical protein F511_31495 [Dorcoceras hygrometricum]|uniref:Uncharacterized protein n=1 Tax=Dorcoceras hygrometricum TaxID=472368 RepID=A0A2Z7A4J2_9LAMI|nr:hypothetical protein F511_31495 [Dorcoceras hygrometricum]